MCFNFLNRTKPSAAVAQAQQKKKSSPPLVLEAMCTRPIAAFILLSALLCCQVPRASAIRGALFRSGRSSGDPYPFYASSDAFGSEEQDYAALNFAHPSVVVDLRRLLELQREKANAGTIGATEFGEQQKGNQQFANSARLPSLLGLVARPLPERIPSFTVIGHRQHPTQNLAHFLALKEKAH